VWLSPTSPLGRRRLRDTISPDLEGVARTPACNGGMGRSMPTYRCYFLNLHSHIERVEIIEADTDSDAVERGDVVFREKGAGFSGVEVWDRGRRVERALDDGPEQIRRWRMKAEEIRTAVESFTNESARQAFLNSAQTYETLANSTRRGSRAARTRSQRWDKRSRVRRGGAPTTADRPPV
jgi:hypothetical protein